VSAAVEIERRGADVIDELEPLWLVLKNHHGSVTPDSAIHDDARSWAERRASYAEWLVEEGAFALLARQDGRPVGYAITVIHPGSPTWIDPDRYAGVIDIAVAPEAQGAGVGRALLDRVHDESGCDVIELTVLSANGPARAFYERIGFEPHSEVLRRRRQ
jgi:ribosomal protein S18 acetylase RimI-like enzyme